MISALDACTRIIFGYYFQSRLYLVFRLQKILQYRLKVYDREGSATSSY